MKVGRPPIGERAMTNCERQRRFRDRHPEKSPINRIAFALERIAKAHERIANAVDDATVELPREYFGRNAEERAKRAFRNIPTTD